MLENKYSGMCVGGPYDGTWRSHYGPRFRVALSVPTPPLAEYMDRSMEEAVVVEYSNMTYEHVEAYRYKAPGSEYVQSVDLWIPANDRANGANPMTAIRHIMNEYSAYQRLKVRMPGIDKA